jgi:hypothetical protein
MATKRTDVPELLRFLGWSEGLIAEWRCRRDLNNDEGAADPLVAGIARSREFIKAFGELRGVFGPDCRVDRFKRAYGRSHISFGDSLVEGGSLLEACPNALKLVGGKLPIAALAREPQLNMPELDIAHDVAKRGNVVLLRSNCERAASKNAEQSSDAHKT